MKPTELWFCENLHAAANHGGLCAFCGEPHSYPDWFLDAIRTLTAPHGELTLCRLLDDLAPVGLMCEFSSEQYPRNYLLTAVLPHLPRARRQALIRHPLETVTSSKNIAHSR